MKVDLNITDFLKLPTKIMVSIAIGTSLLLFLPNWFIEKLYMVQFREEYGFVIGIVFVVSFTISIVSISMALYKYQVERKMAKKFFETATQRLDDLSNYQKAIIFALYEIDNHTEELPIHDGAVQILEHNMMIQKAATQYAVADLNNAVFPYFLQPWVVEKLKENSTLLNSFYNAYREFKAY